ncbi:Uncharacterized protein Rs2_09252 [Raphanus sativus]|nr:Uncharacterized protein Rs2_09252 [Raphanus sativus]
MTWKLRTKVDAVQEVKLSASFSICSSYLCSPAEMANKLHKRFCFSILVGPQICLVNDGGADEKLGLRLETFKATSPGDIAKPAPMELNQRYVRCNTFSVKPDGMSSFIQMKYE